MAIFEAVAALTDATTARLLNNTFPGSLYDPLRSWLADALRVDPVERWDADNLKRRHSLFHHVQSTFDTHALATKADVKEVLTAVKELSALTLTHFESMEASMDSVSVRIALGDEQHAQGLLQLQAALQQQGEGQINAINRAVTTLGPEMAASFRDLNLSTGDQEMAQKIEKLVSMVSSMQEDVSSIKKCTSYLARLTAKMENKMNIFPLSFIIKPKPETALLPANASMFSKVSNLVTRRVNSKVSKLCWDISILKFVDPLTMKKVPCGPNGDGYEICIPSEMLKVAVPALKYGIILLKVAFATQGLGAAVPDISGLLPDLNDAYLNAMFQSCVRASIAQQDKAMDMAAELPDDLDSALDSLVQRDDSAAMNYIYSLVKKAEGQEANTNPQWTPTMTGLHRVYSKDGSNKSMWVSDEGEALYNSQLKTGANAPPPVPSPSPPGGGGASVDDEEKAEKVASLKLWMKTHASDIRATQRAAYASRFYDLNAPSVARLVAKILKDAVWLTTQAGVDEEDAEQLMDALRRQGMLLPAVPAPAPAPAPVAGGGAVAVGAASLTVSTAVGGAATTGVVTGTATTADVAPPPAASLTVSTAGGRSAAASAVPPPQQVKATATSLVSNDFYT